MKVLDPEPRWRRTTAAGNAVLGLELGETRMLFALGPPRPAGEPGERLAAAVDELRPGVHTACWAQQVHGRAIASIGAGERLTGPARRVGTCDGLITDRTGVAVAVWTADCVPLLMAGGGVVAAIHAGWRGAATDIAAAAVERFRSEFGVEARELSAALGPAVSGPHYAVGDEVIAALEPLGVDESMWRDGRHVDLRGLVRGRLNDVGVTHIEMIGGCTFATAELASYRRDGDRAGRQWSMVYRSASR